MNRWLTSALAVAASLFIFVLPAPHSVSVRTALLILLGATTLSSTRRDEWRTLPLQWSFCAWAVLALVSLTYAVRPTYSLGEIKVEIVYSFLVYAAFYLLAARGVVWRSVLWSMFVSLAVLSLTNIFLWKTTGDVDHPRYFYNGVGAYTTYLATVFPFVVLLLVTLPGTGVKKWLLSMAPLAFLVPAYITANRAFWAAVAASCVTLSVLLLMNARTRAQKLGVVLGLVVAVSASMVAFVGALERRAPAEPGAEAMIDNIVQTDPRPPIWHFVIERLAAHPERGVGFGLMSFRYAYPQWKERNSLLVHAHNAFLNAGAQMGVPGILVMLWLFAAVLREYWRLYQSDERVLQWIAACGMAMVVAVVTKNMTDDFFRRDLALLFWALVGLSLGHGRYLANARHALP